MCILCTYAQVFQVISLVIESLDHRICIASAFRQSQFCKIWPSLDFHQQHGTRPSFPILRIVRLIKFCHFGRCAVVFHCGLNVHFCCFFIFLFTVVLLLFTILSLVFYGKLLFKIYLCNLFTYLMCFPFISTSLDLMLQLIGPKSVRDRRKF